MPLRQYRACVVDLLGLGIICVLHHCTIYVYKASRSCLLAIPIFHIIINPRRACAARVTVLGLCVCVSVCLSVCYHVFCHRARQCAQQDIPATSAGHEQSFKNGVFFKNAWFRSYGVICLPRQHPALLQ